MRYEFFDRDGVEYVRIYVDMDAVERPATAADHEAADVAAANAPPSAAEPTQKQLEKEFDAALAHELDDGNGKKRKHKHAE